MYIVCSVVDTKNVPIFSRSWFKFHATRKHPLSVAGSIDLMRTHRHTSPQHKANSTLHV